MNDRVPVFQRVYEGIEAVRRRGAVNMFDRPRVAEIAELLGFDEAAEWIRSNPELYARAIFHGFEVRP